MTCGGGFCTGTSCSEDDRTRWLLPLLLDTMRKEECDSQWFLRLKTVRSDSFISFKSAPALCFPVLARSYCARLHEEADSRPERPRLVATVTANSFHARKTNCSLRCQFRSSLQPRRHPPPHRTRNIFL